MGWDGKVRRRSAEGSDRSGLGATCCVMAVVGGAADMALAAAICTIPCILQVARARKEKSLGFHAIRV